MQRESTIQSAMQLALALAIATNLLGLWLARRTPTAMFYQVAYVLMFVISLGLIWQGVNELRVTSVLLISACPPPPP